MAKRFTSTEIWDEDWFIEMPIEYQLFWFYMKDKCDHAGFFKVNVTKFNKMHNANIDSELAYEMFNKGKKRLRKINEGMWFIEDFFVFQNGSTINMNNNAHRSVKQLLEYRGVSLGSLRGLKEVKEGCERPPR